MTSLVAVKDANNAITTYTHNVARNITGVVNPLGRRFTLAWSLDQLTSYTVALGRRQSGTVEVFANRHSGRAKQRTIHLCQ